MKASWDTSFFSESEFNNLLSKSPVLVASVVSPASGQVMGQGILFKAGQLKACGFSGRPKIRKGWGLGIFDKTLRVHYLFLILKNYNYVSILCKM